MAEAAESSKTQKRTNVLKMWTNYHMNGMLKRSCTNHKKIICPYFYIDKIVKAIIHAKGIDISIYTTNFEDKVYDRGENYARSSKMF